MPGLARAAQIFSWEVGESHTHIRTLAALAPHLPEELLGETLVAARKIRDGNMRACALSNLAPHLSEGSLKEALVAVRKIKIQQDNVKCA